MTVDLAALRRSYTRGGLDAADLAPRWDQQLARWLDEAVAADLCEPTAMTLATATPGGVPSARTVLLKGVRPDGVVFFTNYTSRKGRELADNPACALVLAHLPLERQVVLTGRAHRLPRADTVAYATSRPRGSQLGAWVSRQSRVIPDRAVLTDRAAVLAERFGAGEVPVPDFWGGFLVRPDSVEFWQGRPDRLHDRLRYRWAPGDGPSAAGSAGRAVPGDGPTGPAPGWVVERLSP